MNKVILPLVALVVFAAYTAWVMLQADQSLIQFGMELMSRPDTAQVVIDLYILAALSCCWMYGDAKTKGKSLSYVLPFFVITAVFVSIGPLLYLVVGAWSDRKESQQIMGEQKN